ncbi:MAG: NotI family restriction endonuclease [Prosthecobacter sp.]|uniref:NotI family restriction endonuclease n=1 Tax=Prosthecobacter sp. TaxID=1965333 RepID=UPI0038FFEAF9
MSNEPDQHSKEETKAQRPPKFFGIAEWYGQDVACMTADARRRLAKIALSKKVKIVPCPFRAGRKCHKAGGVCTLRSYSREDARDQFKLGSPVTVCPSRFFDREEIFRWVGEVMLGTQTPKVLGEIRFLQRITEGKEQDSEDADFIGRIDNILVHPEISPRLHWCALELQAVYFSGKAMAPDFQDIHEHPDDIRFPVGKRHPDFRSSGPKRLLPQLLSKVPELSRWGRKMAVCVDESFFAELVGLEEVKHLSNADIAWFVVKYEPEGGSFRLARSRCFYSKLDNTLKALTGGVPLPQEAFEAQIRAKLISVA